MTFEREPVKVYRVTIKKLIENLSKIKNCAVEDFNEEITEAFDGYDYNDIEELTGFEQWPDITQNGTYKLCVGVDHPHSYKFTLEVLVKDGMATVENVL